MLESNKIQMLQELDKLDRPTVSPLDMQSRNHEIYKMK